MKSRCDAKHGQNHLFTSLGITLVRFGLSILHSGSGWEQAILLLIMQIVTWRFFHHIDDMILSRLKVRKPAEDIILLLIPDDNNIACMMRRFICAVLELVLNSASPEPLHIL